MIRALNNHLYFFLFFFTTFFTYLLGGLLSSYLVSQGYDKAVNPEIYTDSAIYLALVSTIYFATHRTVFRTPRPKLYQNFKGSKVLFLLPLSLVLISVATYFFINGFVLLADEGYASRYTANTGLGVYTQLMQFVFVAMGGYLAYYPSQTSYRLLAISTVIFAALTFVLLGGHRQLGFGTIVGLLVYLALDGRIRVPTFLLTLFTLLFTSLFVAILRYNSDGTNLLEAINRVVIYLYDGVTPIDAHARIRESVNEGTIPGTEIIVAQFSSFIPRALWEGKPEIVMNGGNFYTSIILGRPDFITYSPTIIGELLLAHGTWFMLTAPILAVCLLLIDRSIRVRSPYGYVFIAYSFVAIFNLYREGLYVFLSRIIVMLLFTFFILALAKNKRYKF